MVVLNSNALDLCVLGINIDDRITGERASRLGDMRGRRWIDVSRLSHATRIDDDLAVHRKLARDMAFDSHRVRYRRFLIPYRN